MTMIQRSTVDKRPENRLRPVFGIRGMLDRIHEIRGVGTRKLKPAQFVGVVVIVRANSDHKQTASRRFVVREANFFSRALKSVPVNGDELRRIAALADGSFFAAATTEELTQVYTDLGSSVGFDTELRSIQGWFVAIALVLALVVSALSLAWFSRLP